MKFPAAAPLKEKAARLLAAPAAVVAAPLPSLACANWNAKLAHPVGKLIDLQGI